MRVRSCATTREPWSPASRPRAGHIASISSRRITAGFPVRLASSSAFRNASLSFASESPAYGPKTSPALSAVTAAPASRATAATAAVFPVPGGPWSNTPRGKVAPRADAKAACAVGQTIASRSARERLGAPGQEGLGAGVGVVGATFSRSAATATATAAAGPGAGAGPTSAAASRRGLLFRRRG